jgi:hypothetical protein
MDLSLLPHLSERALRQEAERRGVDVDGLDRAEMVAAIRAHEARALTRPPAALAPDTPSDADASDPAPDVPIRTRAMARLLEQQGHAAGALAIVVELRAAQPDDPELSSWEERLRAAQAQRSFEAATLELGVRWVDTEPHRGVAWRIDEGGLERARAVLGAVGRLALRVVRVVSHADGTIESRVEDRRPAEARGFARIDAPPGARLVVAIGVAEGDRFVSIAHTAAR